MPDRVEPGFFESDEDGYMQASEEVGADGKAKGIEVILWVERPEAQLAHANPDWTQGFKFTEVEIDSWPTWIEHRYPKADWNFDADVAEASFYSDFQNGEDNHALMMRLCVYNGAYNEIRDNCCTLYDMLNEYIAICEELREASGVGSKETE